MIVESDDFTNLKSTDPLSRFPVRSVYIIDETHRPSWYLVRTGSQGVIAMHKLKLVLVWLMFFLKQRFLPSRWLYQLLALSTFIESIAWGMFTSGPCNTPIIICMMDESAWVPYPVHLSYLSDFSWFSSSINSNYTSIKNKLATKSFTQNHFDPLAMIFWCIPT
jgi:hypothetical protein